MAVIRFLTYNWPDKVLALLFAVIIFWVVDRQISDTYERVFVIETRPTEQTDDRRGEPTLLLVASGDDYAVAVDPPPNQNRLTRRTIRVIFSGPRQAIEDLKSGGVLRGSLRIERSLRPDNDEESWTVPASKIAFSGVDSRVISVDAPDLALKASRIGEQRVEVALPLIERSNLVVPPDHDVGDPVPAERSVVIRGPAKVIKTLRVVLEFTADARARSQRAPGLSVGDNRLRCRVVAPQRRNDKSITITPAEIDVNLPVVPQSQTMDIEVRIDVILPTDGSMGRRIPVPSKARETFTFIGPRSVLERCKSLEGSNQEIRALIDLSRLDAENTRRLISEGLERTPQFVYPDFASGLRCQQPKAIWISSSKGDD